MKSEEWINKFENSDEPPSEYWREMLVDLAASEAEIRKAHDLLREVVDCEITFETGTTCEVVYAPHEMMERIRMLIGG